MWLFNWFFDSNTFPQRSHLLHLISWLSDPFVFLCVRFGLMLFNHCAGMVKQRTCFTNYAPLWANMKFLHDNFRSRHFFAKNDGSFCLNSKLQIYSYCRTVYEDLGYPWSKFQDFLEVEQVAAMQSLHIETGVPILIHQKSHIFVRQRCLHGQEVLNWPIGVGQ